MDGKQVKNKSNPTGTTKMLCEDGQYREPIGGGGGTLISNNSILNFMNEEDKVTITVLNASITNANVKSFSFIPIETSETSLDDFSLNGLSFSISNIIDNTSFDIIGTAVNNASGNYTIKYLITI